MFLLGFDLTDDVYRVFRNTLLSYSLMQLTQKNLFLMWSLEEINNPLTKTKKKMKECFCINIYFVVFVLVTSHHSVIYVRE